MGPRAQAGTRYNGDAPPIICSDRNFDRATQCTRRLSLSHWMFAIWTLKMEAVMLRNVVHGRHVQFQSCNAV